jgi:RND family efflux transporter MFP subunit
MKKAVLVLVCLAAVGWAGWRGYQKITAKLAAEQSKSTSRGKAPVAVEVAAVVQAPIRDLRVLSGTLRANAQFNLAPKIAGRLEALTVRIGDPVRRGQEIGHLESAEYVQRVEQAQAELQVAQANVEQCSSTLAQARRESERAEALRQKQVASQAELDTAQSHLQICTANQKVALAQVAQREAALRAAEVQLSYTRIVAMWEDQSTDVVRVIGERFVDEGAMLKANDPIVSVVELHPIRAVVQVTEREYPSIRVGQTTELGCDAFPDRSFSGDIVRIAPLLKETSREALVEIDVANPDQALKPGMFVRVTLELARRETATVIPVSALARRGDAQGVFLVDAAAKTVHFVPTVLGILSGEQAEVLSPALEGTVVTVGQHLLDEGSAVLLPGAAREGSGATGKTKAPEVPKKEGGA